MSTVRISVGQPRVKGSRKRVETKPVWEFAGLAVTPAHERKGYAITHVASGYAALDGIRRRKDAVAVACMLLDAGDWNQSRTSLLRDRALKRRALEIRAEARERGLVS